MTNTTDIINGAYEFLGALFILLNIRRAAIDQEIKGVSLVPTTFFTSWGFWNVYFYPANDLMVSAIGAAFLALANLTWLGQAVYYKFIAPPWRLIQALERKDGSL